METLEKSILMSMDCTDPEILPFLPYILQDFWEIGTATETIISLVQKHTKDYSKLQVLDLGCGKGAVSISLANKFKCHCLGIDAIAEFIDEANRKAKAFNVDTFCTFQVGDIREQIETLAKHDIIILGGIGPVFGNYLETLTTLSRCLNEHGIIIIEDGYIEDHSTFEHPLLLKKQEIIKGINKAQMESIDEVILKETKTEYEKEIDLIERRCRELIKKYPDKRDLFENYINKQKEEYDMLENKVVSSTMVIKKR